MSDRLSGLAFPFRIRRGGCELAAGIDKVEQDLRQLLGTRLGERVMLRAYGTGIDRHLQDPSDPALRTEIRFELERALAAYLPTARLAAPIQVTAREEELMVSVQYRPEPDAMLRSLEIQVP